MIANEYALVVGIITPQRRYDDPDGRPVGGGWKSRLFSVTKNSWLIDGGTPIEDVMRVLDIDEFPQSGNHETIGGFMMFMLRKNPETYRLGEVLRLQI